MAEYLAKCTKNVLLLLAEEFDITVTKSDKNRALVQAIVNASDYDELYAKARLEGILNEEAERKEREKQLEKDKIELEKDKIAKQHELEKIAKQNELEKDKMELEKDKMVLEKDKIAKQHELEKDKIELEKMRIQNSTETISVSSNESNSDLHRTPKVNLKDLVPRFDSKSIDVTLFFMIFEKQAERAKISQEDWVSQLIPLLPSDIVEIIVKLPADNCDDFLHVKKVLLDRFRLSAGALKQKFENHQKKSGELWTDLIYELRGYLENWLDSLEIKDFDSLKELMLTEQLKKRVPFEMKEKFMDEWEDVKIASKLAEKCDKFDSVRREFKRVEKKPWEKKSFQENQNNDFNPKAKNEFKPKLEFEGKKDTGKQDQFKNDHVFNRRKPVICYQCNLEGHIRPNCPELKVNSDYEDKNIGWIVARDREAICKRNAENQLPMIDLCIHGKSVRAVNDTGAEIAVFDNRDIPWRTKKVGNIFLVPALGKKKKADLVSIPIALREGNKVHKERNVIVAAVNNLNCPPLITPAIYSLLKTDNLDTRNEVYKELKNESELSGRENSDLSVDREGNRISKQVVKERHYSDKESLEKNNVTEINSSTDVIEGSVAKRLNFIERMDNANQTDYDRCPDKNDQSWNKRQERYRNTPRYFVGSVGIAQIGNRIRKRVILNGSKEKNCRDQRKKYNGLIWQAKCQKNKSVKSESKGNIGECSTVNRNYFRNCCKIPDGALLDAQISKDRWVKGSKKKRGRIKRDIDYVNVRLDLLYK